uniref:Uncharacterized protein MANES_01G108800 n=1 Tax=Rhizophora mucronata TaxID=61149 RepID=A0A2P2J5U1_RHIMU
MHLPVTAWVIQPVKFCGLSSPMGKCFSVGPRFDSRLLRCSL